MSLRIETRDEGGCDDQVEHMALRHEAQGWALLGDTTACLDRLSRSVDALARSDSEGEPAFASGFSMSYLNVQIAGCYVELGWHLEAIEIYERDLASISPGYVRAFNLARLARGYSGVGEPDRANEIGREAMTLARQTGAARAMGEFRRVHAYPTRWWA